MRGFGKDFIYINYGTPVELFLIGDPVKYSAHFTEGTKKNCHEEECPFCNMGIPVRRGLYSVAIVGGGKVGFVDIGSYMYYSMVNQIKAYCASHHYKLVNVSSFLKDHVVSVTKVVDQDNRTKYNFKFNLLSDENKKFLINESTNAKSTIGVRCINLQAVIDELAKPGSLAEDGLEVKRAGYISSKSR